MVVVSTTISGNMVQLDQYETAPSFFSSKPKLDNHLFVDFCFFTNSYLVRTEIILFFLIFRTILGSQQVKTENTISLARPRTATVAVAVLG